MIGITLAARWSARSTISATAFWRASSRFGLPSATPRALAAAKASVVRLLISARSFCASAANRCRIGINVRTEISDQERHPMNHQARDEMNITGQPVQFGDGRSNNAAGALL